MNYECLRIINYFILLVTFISTAQTKTGENDSLLIWNKSKKLSWENFLSTKKVQIHKYEDNAQEHAGAVLVTSISIFPKELDCEDVNDISIVAITNKEKSYAIIKKDKVLNHEQTHFDIAELYARKMRKALDNILTEDTECDLQSIADMYYNLEEEFWQTQFRYDREVRIKGEEETNQKKWDREVDSLLNVYKDYEQEIYIEDLELD